MNRIFRNSHSATSGVQLATRLVQGTLALLLALCLFAAPNYAHAACGNFEPHSGSTSAKMPPSSHPTSDFSNHWERPTIVGLWHVIYTAGGMTFNDTFDTWHADGTEFESAFLPSAAGNVCTGVWAPTGRRSVKLYHIGWLYNPGTPLATASNYFTLNEEITVAEDNKSYSGTFTFTVYNLDGTPTKMPAVEGTMESTRITADGPA